MNSLKVFLGVVVGAAAGALAGVLFAPAKGSETRKKIKRQGEDYSDAVKGKVNESFEAVTDSYEKMKEGVLDYFDKKMNGSGKADKGKKPVKATKA